MSDPSKLSPGFPFRLVHHELPDDSAHLDLFIDVDPTLELVTYEVRTDFLSELGQWMEKQGPGTPPHFEARPWGPDGHEGEYRAEVKKPHRRQYLTYEGPISHDRGRIKEVVRGRVEFVGGTTPSGDIMIRLRRPES